MNQLNWVNWVQLFAAVLGCAAVVVLARTMTEGFRRQQQRIARLERRVIALWRTVPPGTCMECGMRALMAHGHAGHMPECVFSERNSS